MKKIYTWFSIFSFFIIGIFITFDNGEVYAKSNDVLNFSYENVIPKNQIGQGSYFELKVKPGDKQTVVTKIRNKTNKKIIVQVKINDASTSSSGIINYGPSKEKLVGKNTISILDIIDAPRQVTLGPKEMKEIEFKINVPKKEFDGIILGGIQLKELKDESNSKLKKGAGIINEYSYTYSISLRENNKEIRPELVFDGVEYNQLAYSLISNIEPVITEEVKIESELMTEKSDKVIKNFKVDNYRIAPHSTLVLPLSGTEELGVGKYRLKTVVQSREQKWEFKGKFEITKKDKDASKVYFDDESDNKKMSILIIIIIIVSFIAMISLIYFLLNKKSKKQNKLMK